MKQLLTGIFGTLAAGALLFAAVLYGGFVNVAADVPHSAPVYWLIETARKQAIERNIRDITPPGDLAEASRVLRGAGNYEAMCADCHLSPGKEDSEIRKGLYPVPPDLVKTKPIAAKDHAWASRQFWIIKHGIKASGMAAWSRGGMGDTDIWDLVAFLQRLPALSPDQYRDLVAKSDGHSHGGLGNAHAPAGAHHDAPSHAHAGHKH